MKNVKNFLRPCFSTVTLLSCAFISPQMGGHGVFGGSGGGMPPPRGMHQPGMHPVNPSQGLRAQVPHQFLSAQVCCLLFLMLFDDLINIA